MIISDKQVLQLIRIAEGCCNLMHVLGEYKQVEEVQNLLLQINDQQSEELKQV